MEYHVLNGDALNDRWPNRLKGKRIVFRECLIEGPFKAANLTEFFELRGSFLESHYSNEENTFNYLEETVCELKNLENASSTSAINLWFEEDLFCQANLWFLCHYLWTELTISKAFWVRPQFSSPYGFGALDQEGLIAAYTNRSTFNTQDYAQLWYYYANEEFEKLLTQGEGLGDLSPFVLPAIKAHVAQQPIEGFLGRPRETLRQLKLKYGSDNFGLIFKEFSEIEAIYGFGDLQVRRMFKELDS
ncbi:MAG: hypothetical protein RLZZ242_225 [Bacteroidota bacterium]|jgi:hypothetical protein